MISGVCWKHHGQKPPLAGVPTSCLLERCFKKALGVKALGLQNSDVATARIMITDMFVLIYKNKVLEIFDYIFKLLILLICCILKNNLI